MTRYIHKNNMDYYTHIPENCTLFTRFKYLLKHQYTNETMIVSGNELIIDVPLPATVPICICPGKCDTPDKYGQCCEKIDISYNISCPPPYQPNRSQLRFA